MDVVSALAATEVEANPNDLFGEVSKPVEEVKITSITVQEKQ
jgi:hypothetical protein